jgi:hypothetical protein
MASRSVVAVVVDDPIWSASVPLQNRIGKITDLPFLWRSPGIERNFRFGMSSADAFVQNRLHISKLDPSYADTVWMVQHLIDHCSVPWTMVHDLLNLLDYNPLSMKFILKARFAMDLAAKMPYQILDKVSGQKYHIKTYDQLEDFFRKYGQYGI